MSTMIFLVDGYNVTKSDPATSGATLEEQRNALVSRLRARGRELLGAGRIVVVFDGAGGYGVSSAGSAPVEVRFSRDASADDLIVALASSACERVCLVSSDSALAASVVACASYGAEVRGREVLFEASSGGRHACRCRQRRAGRENKMHDLGVPPGGNSITRELEKLWITDEE